jgi:hypothetical protein
MGTILGALLHSGRGLAGEGGRPVYPGYGWPMVWKTNAPDFVIEAWNQNRATDLGAYNKDGVRPTVFLATTIMWFLAALIAEGLLAGLACLVVLPGGRLRRLWPSARPP